MAWVAFCGFEVGFLLTTGLIAVATLLLRLSSVAATWSRDLLPVFSQQLVLRPLFPIRQRPFNEENFDLISSSPLLQRQAYRLALTLKRSRSITDYQLADNGVAIVIFALFVWKHRLDAWVEIKYCE